MTLVDFSVTHVGLEEQLLGKLILKACSPTACCFRAAARE